MDYEQIVKCFSPDMMNFLFFVFDLLCSFYLHGYIYF